MANDSFILVYWFDIVFTLDAIPDTTLQFIQTQEQTYTDLCIEVARIVLFFKEELCTKKKTLGDPILGRLSRTLHNQILVLGPPTYCF